MKMILPYTLLVALLSLVGAGRLGSQTTTFQMTSSPPTVNYLDVNDSVQLAYTDEGEAREGTLLFIHGLGSNLQAWNKTVAGLGNRFRCVAIDLPGYGNSGQGEYSFTMSFYANQVDAFVQKMGLPPLILVGHSMGGQIALELASRQPEWLERLVLVAPAGLESFSDRDRQFFATYVRPEIIQSLSPEQIEANFDLNFHGGTPDDARFMIDDRMTLREDTAAYPYYASLIAGSVAGMLAGPVDQKLDRVEVPTLIVFGRDDQLIPNRVLHPQLTLEEVGRAAKEGIAEVRIEYLDDAGHFVQWDRAEEFNRLLADFAAGGN
ncbi:pimeloyl-ACP methyl ester carboxylesterase [Lewinella aquimaris]|uniref:Pimeloyl-ACP methyl ester carboxylesterase n=1 Tax=Neolewinella aquimaris TaxID=1835722 RepID=A0A840E7H5_9BACT|nr:alpha/beta hydrolase [Neolewinella aquimaris]MBB4079893.1 pimeloyl-ACP methyl ester carboxylesterase [Neolewinella aquimaris]